MFVRLARSFIIFLVHFSQVRRPLEVISIKHHLNYSYIATNHIYHLPKVDCFILQEHIKTLSIYSHSHLNNKKGICSATQHSIRSQEQVTCTETTHPLSIMSGKYQENQCCMGVMKCQLKINIHHWQDWQVFSLDEKINLKSSSFPYAVTGSFYNEASVRPWWKAGPGTVNKKIVVTNCCVLY